MYELIEKEFKKNNPYKKYRIIYWVYCFILVLIVNLINIVFKINNLVLVIITFLTFIISVFMFIYFKIKKNYSKKKFKKYKFIKLLKEYVQNLNLTITKNLIVTLKENNVNSKDKLKILIDYYNRKGPISIKTGFTSIIADLFVTIASIVVIAYNDITKILNINTVINIVYYSLIATLIIFILTVMIKYIYRGIFPQNEYYNSSLLDELTYIYMNYNHYKNKLK